MLRCCPGPVAGGSLGRRNVSRKREHPCACRPQHPQGMGAGLVFQLCGCCCLARVGKGFVTGSASAALVRFTGENVTNGW